MGILKVRAWEKWQSYRRDRGQPPWIKLHRRLLLDVEWVALCDAAKGQLVSMWLLAAERDGEIPDDPKVLKRLCHLDREPNISFFVDNGFLERRQVDASMTPDATVTPEGRHSDALGSEAETETERRRATAPAVPPAFDEFWAAYPRKVGKGDALHAWKKLKPSDALLRHMLGAIVEQKKSEDWKTQNGRFVPNPATWLRQGRWDDEPTKTERPMVI